MGVSDILKRLHHTPVIHQEELNNLLPKNLIVSWRKEKILTDGETLHRIQCRECNACFSKIEATPHGVRAYCEKYNDFYDLPDTFRQPCLNFNDERFLSKIKKEF